MNNFKNLIKIKKNFSILFLTSPWIVETIIPITIPIGTVKAKDKIKNPETKIFLTPFLNTVPNAIAAIK